MAQSEPCRELLEELVKNSRMPLWDALDPTVDTFWSCTSCHKDWYGEHTPDCPIGRAKRLLGDSSSATGRRGVLSGTQKSGL